MTNAIEELVSKIGHINPTQKSFLQNGLSQLGENEVKDLNSYIQFCTNEDLTLDYLAKSYNLIVQETFKEQVYFQRNKKYRYSTFDEVANGVYYNEEYMKKYMVGLALSTFFWENHLQLHHFFMKSIPKNMTGKYLEVGPGHGFCFMQAMRNSQFSSYTGIDISETSVNMTKSILNSQYFGEFKNYEIKHADFLNYDITDDQKFDFQVMSEVLEHVEKPELLLQKIGKYSTPEGKIFITTCINAPAVDHIYLYTDQDHVCNQVQGAGLKIEDELWVPYIGLTMEESLEKKLPINLAMVLSCPK